MPACTTCGGTEDVHLYERHDPRYEPRTWWWCVDCAYFAVRLNGIGAEPRASQDMPAEDRRDRRVYGRRASDRVFGVEA